MNLYDVELLRWLQTILWKDVELFLPLCIGALNRGHYLRFLFMRKEGSWNLTDLMVPTLT